MKKFLLAAPVVIAFAACSGGGAKLQPGNYEMTTKVTSAEIPGAPPAMIEKMTANEQKQTQCLTQADIDNFGEKLAQSGAQGANCNFSKKSFGSGTIDVAGTCTAAGNEATVTMTGSNTGDSFNTTTSFAAAQGGQQMKITAETTARRLGDCPNK